MTADSDRVLQVQTTVDDRTVAEEIAAVLVDERLAACVQVLGPTRSHYRWEGKVEVAEEWLLLAKTTGAAYPALAARIRSLHPYEEPELIALPVEEGSGGYLAWVAASTSR